MTKSVGARLTINGDSLFSKNTSQTTEYVFANYTGKTMSSYFALDNIHNQGRGHLQLPKDCVVHSLRHTFFNAIW